MRKILLATAAGFAALVANGAAPTPAYAQAAEVTGQTPAPGLTLSTTGRIRFFGGFISDPFRSTDAGDKVSNFDFNTYGRLRFDLSGRNEAGLIYGGRIEARIDTQRTDTGNVFPPGAGNANVFLRVVNGFIGTPTLGQLRFGSNGVLAVPQMFVGHIMSGIATGLWDGDGPSLIWTGPITASDVGVPSSFWYSATGNVNRSVGIGYYTPQFFGFDAGISYAPNDAAFLGACNVANTGATTVCDRASTVDANGERRLRNIIDAMLRYRGTFGGVGIAVSGGLRTADVTKTIAPAVAQKDPTVGIFGAEVTFAGFTVGGITTFGSANRGFAALPKTGNNSDLFSWQLGARYTFGAFTVGATYHEQKSEGNTGNAADLKERGFGVGGTYALGPGLSLFAEYLWGRSSESRLDFTSERAGNQERITSQVFMLGVAMGF